MVKTNRTRGWLLVVAAAVGLVLMCGQGSIGWGGAGGRSSEGPAQSDGVTQPVTPTAADSTKGVPMLKNLTPQERYVIVRKGTEPPFVGKYTSFFQPGTYTCKRCGAKLFESSSKFRSDCGWPSFDEQIPEAVRWLPDADGMRTEIVCAACGAHLGHVFLGEQFTAKNTRYCVNSISMGFTPAALADAAASPGRARAKTEHAVFAAGCFWGVEYYLKQTPGVISVTVGYTGGRVQHPTYWQVCTGLTGHVEAADVVFDPNKTSYEQLARLFFEIHDFTQANGQGPDIGAQYRSVIFYANDQQRQVAERLIGLLKAKGYAVKTRVMALGAFWPAEKHHQDYYAKTGGTPYCHFRRPVFQTPVESPTAGARTGK
jgi:peptide methionine sulfoxide reductase msrA/msrB